MTDDTTTLSDEELVTQPTWTSTPDATADADDTDDTDTTDADSDDSDSGDDADTIDAS